MKELKRVSRWITVNSMEVTEKHRLYCYAVEKDETTKKGYLYYFRHNGKLYSLDQFINRWSMYGFDQSCKEYPRFICGYDCENYYNPLLIELDEYGEKVRLYVEV